MSMFSLLAFVPAAVAAERDRRMKALEDKLDAAMSQLADIRRRLDDMERRMGDVIAQRRQTDGRLAQYQWAGQMQAQQAQENYPAQMQNQLGQLQQDDWACNCVPSRGQMFER